MTRLQQQINRRPTGYAPLTTCLNSRRRPRGSAGVCASFEASTDYAMW